MCGRVLKYTNLALFHRAFSKAKNSVVCAEFPMGSKSHFSQWNIYFSQFLNKFLKFEEIKNLIVTLSLNNNKPYLCKFPLFFQIHS